MVNELLIVGSVALDSVKTPFGEVTEALGGSATYGSYSASFFTGVRLVGVVGEDFLKAAYRAFERPRHPGRMACRWSRENVSLGRRLRVRSQ